MFSLLSQFTRCIWFDLYDYLDLNLLNYLDMMFIFVWIIKCFVSICRIAYSSMGNHAKAVECYRKGIELDPTNENCQKNLAIAEERLRSGCGVFGSDLNLGAIFNNPMMQSIAQQFMSDPNAQNV